MHLLAFQAITAVGCDKVAETAVSRIVHHHPGAVSAHKQPMGRRLRKAARSEDVLAPERNAHELIAARVISEESAVDGRDIHGPVVIPEYVHHGDGIAGKILVDAAVPAYPLYALFVLDYPYVAVFVLKYDVGKIDHRRQCADCQCQVSAVHIYHGQDGPGRHQFPVGFLYYA